VHPSRHKQQGPSYFPKAAKHLACSVYLSCAGSKTSFTSPGVRIKTIQANQLQRCSLSTLAKWMGHPRRHCARPRATGARLPRGGIPTYKVSPAEFLTLQRLANYHCQGLPDGHTKVAPLGPLRAATWLVSRILTRSTTVPSLSTSTTSLPGRCVHLLPRG